jgi:DNA-binding NtrC family response regulator
MARPTERARVLVVDDRAEMAEIVAEALCERGYDGVAVTSGPDAFRRLHEERVDALVTDLRMPDVDGLTLLRLSRMLDPTRPVILMTAYSSLDTALEAAEAGTWQYLTKPFRVEALERLLDEALRLRQARR